jgi:hypothetical protein
MTTIRPGPGRPTTRGQAAGHAMTVRLTPELLAALRARAERERCTLAEAVRRVLEEAHRLPGAATRRTEREG